MDRTTKIDLAIILGAILLAVASLSLIGRLHVDSSTDAFIPQKDKIVAINDKIEAEFGSLDAMMVGIYNPNGTILTKDNLAVIAHLTDQFEAIEGVNSVMTLTNTEHMQPSSDGFEAIPLYDKDEEGAIERLNERLAEWNEVYYGALISQDSSMAAFIIYPKTGLGQDGQDAILNSLKNVVDSSPHDSLEFSYVGLPVVKKQINESLMSDMAILAPIVGLLIILVLLFSFRRLAGIALPIIGLAISASVTVGIMALFNITFTMATMLVPVLLLIVGSAYVIHVMSHFYGEVALANRALSRDETRVMIHEVIKRNRMPIVMAGATTAAGFIAQFTSPLGPFRTFGLLSAIGVVLSQLSSLYLLPALLRVTYRNGIDPNKFRYSQVGAKENSSTKVFNFFSRVALKAKWPLLIISAVLLVITIILIPGIKSGTNMLNFFKPNSVMVKDTNRFNDKFDGSGILTLMIEADARGAVLSPTFLSTIDQFSAELEALDGVGKVQTITPYVKRMNYIMNRENEPYKQIVQDDISFDFFGGAFGFDDSFGFEEEIAVESVSATWDPNTYKEIPIDPAKYGFETEEELQNMIVQYLLLFSGNLDNFINDDLEPDATLLTIQLKRSNTEILRNITAKIDSFWENELPDGWHYSVGGGEAIALALTDLVTKSQIYSLIGALVIVWILVSLIFRSPVAGLLGAIPVVFGLMGIFSFMVILKINLDIITSLLAALAIGIGVDYAIHFLSALQRHNNLDKIEESLQQVMNTTGKAIVINAVSVILGFIGLIFSRFMPIRQLGILFCVSMLFAGLSSLTVLPMVTIKLKPKFIYGDRKLERPKENNIVNKRRIAP
jgi:predicted RND superfamily exporter protein